MDKLKMHSPNKADENFAKLAALFPNAVTETINENGEVVRAIDKDILMQEISCTVVEGKEERYQFTWPDKRKTILLANAPISKTLRPCLEESVNFDTTNNLYIEGDNLEVLKLLQETYLGKVKMIYIDPPYNTGSDFVYEDDFSQDISDYLIHSGQRDDDGNRLFANNESNGRFHTDWLNMMYPRLKISKDLLSDDGVIFISIDEHEFANLKKLCTEVFGSNNYISTIIPIMNPRGSQSSKDIAVTHEYIAIVSKSPNYKLYGLGLSEDQKKEFSKVDANGYYREIGLRKRGADARRIDSPTLYFPIFYNPQTGDISTKKQYEVEIIPKLSDGTDGRWRWSKEKVERDKNELVVRPVSRNGLKEYDIFSKDYLTDDKRRKPMSLWDEKEINNEFATELLHELFNNSKIFDYSKSLFLIKKILSISTKDDDIVLDFFSGSGTTAHAVMELNAEDNGKRQFIMVQLPEVTGEKTEANKVGYNTICEIGKERIRRAGAKIQEQSGMLTTELDIGFRVLKCDTSNMKEVFYKPDEIEQNMFDLFSDNIKEDRTPEDLLFQVMLDLGVLLSSKIEEITIGNCKVFNVAEGFLYACFDNKVSDEVVKEIATKKPYYAVFRDSGMANDSVMTNFDQIFASISPDTVRKVL